MSQTEPASLISKPSEPPSTTGNTISDASLLHQVTNLEMEKQKIIKEKSDLEAKYMKMEEQFKKERAELVAVQKKEMEEQWNAFVQDWLTSLEKENPAVVADMKSGANQMIQEGRNKDRVWEVLCCASQAHKHNVTAIETLTKDNVALLERNKELEKVASTMQGFDNANTRMGKRSRHCTDDEQETMQQDTKEVASSDVWGQFESMMTNHKSY